MKKLMKRPGIMSIIAATAMLYLAGAPKSYAQYDVSDSTGGMGNTNVPIQGQAHDNMDYNWNTGTGVGNNPDGNNGGLPVQQDFGATSVQQISPNLVQPTEQSLLSSPLSGYAFGGTAVPVLPLTYGFSQGNGLYQGVGYARELLNGNLPATASIPTALPPVGTGAVNLNTVSNFGLGGGSFYGALGSVGSLSLLTGVSAIGIGLLGGALEGALGGVPQAGAMSMPATGSDASEGASP
jgi:hypothetical protein